MTLLSKPADLRSTGLQADKRGCCKQNMLSVMSPGLNLAPASVLLVEDEILIRKNLADELREVNIRVIEAASAAEAWDYLQTGNKPDLVFSDVKMPGPYDGLELVRRIQSQFPDLKIIITSGNLGPEQRPAGVLFLPKPYRIDHAVNTAQRFLGLADGAE
jgi:CheY-like chemotaxis protein